MECAKWQAILLGTIAKRPSTMSDALEWQTKMTFVAGDGSEVPGEVLLDPWEESSEPCELGGEGVMAQLICQTHQIDAASTAHPS